MSLRTLLCAGILLSGLGCGAGRQNHLPAPTPAPDWIQKPPSEVFGRKCEIGRSSRTFRMEDARRNAENAARANLAQADRYRVKTEGLDIQRESSSGGASQFIIEVVQVSSEAEVTETETMGTWLDVRGEHAGGEPMVTHAVVCHRAAGR